jgi:hypothetical protein
MHDVGSSVPFTGSSSHLSSLIPIFLRSAHACPWSIVFPSVLSNIAWRLSHTFFLMSITLIEWWTSKSSQYGSSQKNWLLLPHIILFNILASHFPLTEYNMDILNHFIDFVTCEMQLRMPLLVLTSELTLHIPKLEFHWNVVSMSHVRYFSRL